MRGWGSILFLAICTGCVEPYTPPTNMKSLNTLVVDGYVGTDGTALVQLSRSIPLTANDDYFPSEKGATVTIESSSGKIFSLTETDTALYTATGLDTNLNDRYTLNISTAKGDKYISDDVRIYKSPPIDNLYFTISNSDDAVEVRLDATDANPGATGFYLWNCLETYEYHSKVFSGYKLVDHKPVERKPEEVLYTCWRDVTKPAVMATTKFLSQNIISGQVVTTIPKGSDKLSVRYSVLVRQRSISQEEFAFRTQLQNSTEQQGSIFSVIPGAVPGNVHSTGDPGEYVLGYFRGQDLSERRFYINRSELPTSFWTVVDKKDCQPEATCPIGSTGGFGCIPVELLGTNALITNANTDGRGVILSYNFVSAVCGDCTYVGGTATKPSFWVE